MKQNPHLSVEEMGVNVCVGLMRALIDHMASYEFSQRYGSFFTGEIPLSATPCATTAQAKFEKAMHDFYTDLAVEFGDGHHRSP